MPYSGPTQNDLDAAFSQPATGFLPLAQAAFPPGTKKNDQYRIRVTGSIAAHPYGIPVANDVIVVVDNIQTGSESFRVEVTSDYLAGQLTPVNAAVAAANAAATGAGVVSGIAVFYVKSSDATVADPLIGTNCYADFQSAYTAAIALPLRIQKYIVIDDRSVGVQQVVTPLMDSAGTNVLTYNLATNNIKLSTLNTFRNKAGDPADSYIGSTAAAAPIQLWGLYDALHFEGGNWQPMASHQAYSTNPWCVGTSPGNPVYTPSGMKRALEIGDNTQVMLSPLSFFFNVWGYRYGLSNPALENDHLTIGKNSSLTIYPDVSAGHAVTPFGNLYTYDGASLTAGRCNYFPVNYVAGYTGITITLGENASFVIADGTAYYQTGSLGFNVKASPRHGNISFGTNPYTNTITIENGVPVVPGPVVVSTWADLLAIGSYNSIAPGNQLFITRSIKLAASIVIPVGSYIAFGSNITVEGITSNTNIRPSITGGGVGTGTGSGLIDLSNSMNLKVKNVSFQASPIFFTQNIGTGAPASIANGGTVVFEDCDFVFMSPETLSAPNVSSGISVIFRRCTHSSPGSTPMHFTGSVGNILFDECYYNANGYGAPLLSVAGTTLYGHVVANNCRMTGAGVYMDIGATSTSNLVAAAGAAGYILINDLRLDSDGTFVTTPIANIDPTIKFIYIKKSTDIGRGQLPVFQKVLASPPAGGTSFGNWDSLTALQLQAADAGYRLALVNSVVTTTIGPITGPHEDTVWNGYGFVHAGQALAQAITGVNGGSGTPPIPTEIVMGRVMGPGTMTPASVDLTTASATLSSGDYPIMLIFDTSYYTLADDEIADMYFPRLAGTTEAFGILLKPSNASPSYLNSEDTTPMVRLEADYVYYGSPQTQKVRVSTNRRRRGFHVDLIDRTPTTIPVTSFGESIRLTDIVANLTLPGTTEVQNFASLEAGFMKRIYNRPIDIVAEVGCKVTLTSFYGYIRTAANPSPSLSASQTFTIPQFGRVRLIMTGVDGSLHPLYEVLPDYSELLPWGVAGVADSAVVVRPTPQAIWPNTYVAPGGYSISGTTLQVQGGSASGAFKAYGRVVPSSRTGVQWFAVNGAGNTGTAADLIIGVTFDDIATAGTTSATPKSIFCSTAGGADVGSNANSAVKNDNGTITVLGAGSKTSEMVFILDFGTGNVTVVIDGTTYANVYTIDLANQREILAVLEGTIPAAEVDYIQVHSVLSSLSAAAQTAVSSAGATAMTTILHQDLPATAGSGTEYEVSGSTTYRNGTAPLNLVDGNVVKVRVDGRSLKVIA